jgi:hypothetical protein
VLTEGGAVRLEFTRVYGKDNGCSPTLTRRVAGVVFIRIRESQKPQPLEWRFRAQLSEGCTEQVELARA